MIFPSIVKFQRRNFIRLLLCLALLSFNIFADNLPVDSIAPGFKIKDINGSEVSLDQYKGKWVILEWFNKGCPFVKKHYESNNMQTLQKKYMDKGVVWIAIISSSERKQGYESDTDTAKTAKDWNSHPTHIIRDVDGKIGRSYIAKTTPHMYIVSPDQKIVYQGAIDDNNSSNPEDIKTSKNYVTMALDEGLAGKNIIVKKSKPYGCSVKYK